MGKGKGLFSTEREKRGALILDGLFDFKKRYKEKRIFFGTINLGRALERRDYKIFLFLIKLVDNGLLGKMENTKAAIVFDNSLTLLEKRDIEGFNDYVADILAGKIDIPLMKNDKFLFIAVLSLFKALIATTLEKISEIADLAEQNQ